MPKITMKVSVSMRETFDDFLLFKKSMGLSEKTLRTYKEHLLSIGKHLPIDNPIDCIEQKDLEKMISSMRDIGLSSNSIQSYTRTLKSFFSWCKEEGIVNLSLSRYKAEETIKDTYSDSELKLLLKKPNMRKCSLHITDAIVNHWYEDFGYCYTKEEFKLQVHSMIAYHLLYSKSKFNFDVYNYPQK